jgi:ribosomal 50S subunit-associated protein YjgA (DUF615 family)
MKAKFRKIRKIPALKPGPLKSAIERLHQTNLRPSAKRQLEAMLRVAANPDAESPEAVIKTLEPERRANVEATITALSQQRRTVTQRGKDALFGFSEDEWQQMVDEANGS